ncbi:MAG: type II toxin-antitoxin system VapC family toxin [Chloroflexota bacterium]
MALTAALADTSVFIALESGRAVDAAALPDILRISVITVGELRQGVLSALDADIRAVRLGTLTRVLALEPLPITDPVAEAWARLRVQLRALGGSMPVNDSWIAATAITWRIPVVTQDADYDDVPGLEVIRV